MPLEDANARDAIPDSQAVRVHLAKVLASAQFSTAPRLSRFLSFVVDSALEGRSSEIKESLIAVEVYGRPPDYNPQMDSTVRVEAWRLRAKLRDFYATADASDPIVIELPKGKYVPVFRDRRIVEGQPNEQRSARDYFRWIAGGALVLIGIVAATSIANRGTRTAPAELPDAETLKLYSRGWELLRHNRSEDGKILPVEESVRQSIALFEKSLQRNPRYVRGWVSLAEANEFAYELDPNHTEHFLMKARSAARQAIQLDPQSPDAQTVLCSILFFRDWDLPGAEASCRRAVELNGRDVVAQRRLVDIRRVQGHFTEAARELDRAISLLPADPGLRLRKARLSYDTRQYDRAVDEAQASLALNDSRQLPSWTLALWLRGLCQERLGQTGEAEKSYRLALSRDADDQWNQSGLGHLLGRTGRTVEAEVILRDLEQRVEHGRAGM